jgi:uncharacterized membrane protein (GlpM family)
MATLQFILKVAISAILIVVVSEIAKRSSAIAAIIASLPLTSILAFTFLYADTKDVEKVSALSTGILWMIIPSFALFLALPFLLKKGIAFHWALTIGMALTAIAYFAMIAILEKFGIKI